ncbi:putative YigZ family protein [Kineococcus xinjiangensis]|uniref:Putative YigZ family protein n=1 Tax=Kineococcus xinjiangensis TaxID=512762 RepID=A0A2S6IUM8_9ACTN|nr:YigZ family protein [Kineococcus xinjiangensis]PPK97971.1 putative YigZ family protein [Kineococcus xinjiangensis]
MTGPLRDGRVDSSLRDGLAAPVRTETVVERSRFVCTLLPALDAAAADAAVAAVRAELTGAGHHCTAAVLGLDGAEQRSGDDGEPAGTAGAPMLAALRASGLSGLVAVVSRWFGGTLLGTGGLVRAYGGAVSHALEQAPVLRRRAAERVLLTAGHAAAGRTEGELRRWLAASGGVLLDATWAAQGWRAEAAVPAGSLPGLEQVVAALRSGGPDPRLELLGATVLEDPPGQAR